MEANNNNGFSNYYEKLITTNSIKPNSTKNGFEFPPIFTESFTPEVFWKLFLDEYRFLNGRKFDGTNGGKKIVSTLIFYFLRDAEFYNSPCLYDVKCDFSLNKGLIIIGGCGVGKTSILKAIVSLIEKFSTNFYQYPVRMHNTSNIVDEYEDPYLSVKTDIICKYSKSFRIFDDVNNERIANHFGKIDLIKEIIYKRCENKNFRTIILSNYHPDYPNDMNMAIDNLNRYGHRNFDRLHEAYNFIEFSGTSNRR